MSQPLRNKNWGGVFPTPLLGNERSISSTGVRSGASGSDLSRASVRFVGPDFKSKTVSAPDKDLTKEPYLCISNTQTK
jgi:hypothetical protein